MGTNYYMKSAPCSHCGRSDERVHIGKSSAGWCFSLHVIPEMNLNSLEDWKARLANADVFVEDEYGRKVEVSKLLETITQRSCGETGAAPSGYSSWEQFCWENHAEPGPNGLFRHRRDGTGSRDVQHGEGTWDLIPGEFS